MSLNKVKCFSVNLFVNGEYYDCLSIFGGNSSDDNESASEQACEYAEQYQSNQEWFEVHTDYEFTHADDTWEVIVEDSNG